MQFIKNIAISSDDRASSERLLNTPTDGVARCLAIAPADRRPLANRSCTKAPFWLFAEAV